MRIVQIVYKLIYGDAISNHAIALKKEFEQRGITCLLCANSVDQRLSEYAQEYSNYQEQVDDIILFHFGGGTKLNCEILKHKCKIVLNYHNITPPYFFEPYRKHLANSCNAGYADAEMFRDKVDCVISDSEYNSLQLKNMGYTCPLYSAPILVDFEQYGEGVKVGEREIKSDEPIKILFVGRIAPNKCHEKIIRDFYYYSKYYNSNSQLILAGNYIGYERYYLRLKKYVRALGLKNVVFTGHISFSKLLEYYRTSTVFLCESEHEGFCVPLVEAMYFKLPIIAYDSSAIKETLGNAGMIFYEHDPKLVCSLIEKILGDKELRMQLEANQTERLKAFDHKEVLKKYIMALGVSCIEEK